MAVDTLVSGSKLTAIADAIRAKTGGADAMTLDDMVDEIDGISGDDMLPTRASGELSSYANSSITTVGAYAFAGCPRLTSLSLPNATTVGAYAIYESKNLTTLDLPSVTRIEDNGLNSSSGTDIGTRLNGLSLPNVTYIGRNGLVRFRAVGSVSLPRLETLEAYAISSLCEYTSAQYMDDFELPMLTSMKAYALQSIGARRLSIPSWRGGTFDYNTGYGHFIYGSNAIERLDLRGLLTYTPYSNGSFFLVYSCNNVTAVNLESCTSLERGFYSCGKLESLYLPSMRSLGAYVTSTYTTRLKAVVLPQATKVEARVGFNTMFNGRSAELAVYVPRALLGEYQADANWTSGASVLRAMEDYPEVVAEAKASSDLAKERFATG